MSVPLVPADQIPESLRATWEMSSPAGRLLIQAMSNAPAHAERLFPYYNGTRFETKLGIKLGELVRLAIVNITGCQVCQETRLPAATAAGLTEDLALGVSTPTTDRYTPAEQAALAFANKFAGDHYAITDDDFVPLRRHFTTEQIVELGMLCAQYVGFSRLVVSFGLFDALCGLPARPTENLVPATA